MSVIDVRVQMRIGPDGVAGMLHAAADWAVRNEYRLVTTAPEHPDMAWHSMTWTRAIKARPPTSTYLHIVDGASLHVDSGVVELRLRLRGLFAIALFMACSCLVGLLVGLGSNQPTVVAFGALGIALPVAVVVHNRLRLSRAALQLMQEWNEGSTPNKVQ